MMIRMKTIIFFCLNPNTLFAVLLAAQTPRQTFGSTMNSQTEIPMYSNLSMNGRSTIFHNVKVAQITSFS